MAQVSRGDTDFHVILSILKNHCSSIFKWCYRPNSLWTVKNSFLACKEEEDKA